MVDHEGEAAIDAGQEHELDLSLGLRPAPSRCNLQFPNPKNSEAAAPEDSSDLSLNMPIWGIGGTRPTQQSARIGFLGVQTKTEAQALRRQEAKKKKDEKRKLKANALNRNANEMMFWSEKRKALVRERETEEDFAERLRKRGNCGGNEGEEASATTTTSFFVRQAEGFDGNQLNVLPYLIMPGLVGSDGNGFQPVVGAGGAGGIGPYQLVEQICGHKSLKRSVSSCSRGSSPGVSDYQTTSGQGGSSSDGGSHSSHSHPLDLTKKNYLRMSNSTQMQTSHPQPSAPQPNGFAPISYSINGKAECRSSSYQTKPDQTTKKVPNLIEMATTSSKTDPCQLNQNSEVQTQTCPSKKPVLSHRIQSPCLVRNESKGVDLRRPPRPQTHQGNEAVLLPHMPCVATMGNGPNGKRITGFLYKYTKSEVSIVCVCHGNSFSPAGFVEHAGGVDIENPLRHITVAPSTFN